MKVLGAAQVCAVLGAVLGVALAGCGTAQEAAPAATSSTVSAPTTPAPTSAPAVTSAVTPVATLTATPEGSMPAVTVVGADPTPLIDHSGFGAIRLGMTAEQLTATGLVGGVEGPAGELCALYPLRSGGGSVWVQNDGTGVASIVVEGRARTTEGVRTGATTEQVRATYPALSEGANWNSVDLGGGVRYGFLGDPVTTILVFKSGMGCHN
ncbi:hypothetical protein GCM10009660_49610 [Catellatospora bangladeshensis]